jgi:asparagine synthetase B (glutamine-hydrolysing)
MPGLAGWLGVDSDEPVFSSRGLELLKIDPFDETVEVPGIYRGRVYLTHNAANPTDQGILMDEPGGLVLAYWGEFYGTEFDNCGNGAEVCRALADLLGDRAEERLDSIDGSYVLFWQHGGRQLLATDRVASRPVYYRESAHGFAFGPDLKLFSTLRTGKPRIHRDSLVSFLVNGHPLSDETHYEGVRLLRPGRYLRVTPAAAGMGQYYFYKPATPGARDPGTEACEEALAPVLRHAIRKRARYMDRAVVPISGGYDSRCLLACIREIYSGPLKTVSWGVHEKDPEADAAIGRRVAEYFGTEHRFLRRKSELVLEELDPMVDRLDAATEDCLIHHHEATLMRQIRDDLGCTVLFRGDECLGYLGPAHTAVEALGWVNVREISMFPDLHQLFQPGVLGGVFREQREVYDGIIGSCPCTEDWTAAKDWFYLEQRVFRSLNFAHYMKLSVLQARNPWLDRDVLNFFSELPVPYRYDKVLYRRTLGRMFPAVMESIPMARRHSLENWGEVLRQNREFQLYARKHLVESASVIHEIWNPAALDRLLTSFSRGEPAGSRKARALESMKRLLREKSGPLYRMMKKRAGRQFTTRILPPESVIGRLLILKRWCDRWA